MPWIDRSDHIRLVRAVDGVTYSLTAALVIVGLHAFYRVPVAWMPLVTVVPLFTATGATLAMPAMQAFPSNARLVLVRLKLASLCMAGFFFFFIWWGRIHENLYLAVCSGVALLGLAWYLLELMNLLTRLLAIAGFRRTELDARIAHAVVLYAFLVPILSVLTALIAGRLMTPVTSRIALADLWRVAPAIVRAVVVLPPIMVISVLWRARSAVANAEKTGIDDA